MMEIVKDIVVVVALGAFALVCMSAVGFVFRELGVRWSHITSVFANIGRGVKWLFNKLTGSLKGSGGTKMKESIKNGATRVGGFFRRNLALIMVIIILVALGASTGKGIKMYATIYNNLINTKQSVNRAVADLDSQYQKRYALVDNLVAVVKETKGFEKYIMDFEKEVYPAVAEAKASATKMDMKLPQKVAKRISSEAQLGNILTNLFDKIAIFAQKFPVITDPDLKSHDKTFRALDGLRLDLKNLEEEIRVARNNLNERVRVYNTLMEMFPANIVAGHHGFKHMEFFTALSEEARKDVKVEF